MKKVLFLSVLALATMLITTQTKAQKIGSFDEESVIGLMPGIQKIDTVLQMYVRDSLQTEYEYEVAEYKRKDSMVRDSIKPISGSLKAILQKELQQHIYKIQNWQQYQNQKVQQKQDQLLMPYRQKVYDALREIIADQGYSYVIKSEAFFTTPPIKDNLSIKVAQKLKLKLPAEIEEALKDGGSAKPATAPAKAPVRR